MKIYFVVFSDYDLYGIKGIYFHRENAEIKFNELKNDPKFRWKKYLKIEEHNIDDNL